ncbi:hypothetical protein Tco_1086736, partial [Tanacetum coccineum]
GDDDAECDVSDDGDEEQDLLRDDPEYGDNGADDEDLDGDDDEDPDGDDDEYPDDETDDNGWIRIAGLQGNASGAGMIWGGAGGPGAA